MIDHHKKPKPTKGGLRDMRTVFVIGAGANTKIGMPSGEELKDKIVKLLDFFWDRREMTKGDTLIMSALEQCCKNDNHLDYVKLCDAARIIKTAMPLSISIDNFIESQRGDPQIELCGKLAIVRSILAAEQDCALFEAYKRSIRNERNEKKITQLNDSWYPSLFKKITDCCPVDKLAARLSDISFIIFNYDRCFEYFMYNALMTYYQIHQEKAKKIVKNMNILHPYGTVGELWNEQGEITFGETPNQNDLISISEKIKTFTENTGTDKERNRKIKYITERGDRIIFLGFAYHDQNLSLLFDHPSVSCNENIPLSERIICYGTGYNISEKDLETIHNSLIEANFKIVDCTIVNKTCSEFFKDFWYTISFNKKESC
jgi:hypothetical protein